MGIDRYYTTPTPTLLRFRLSCVGGTNVPLSSKYNIFCGKFDLISRLVDARSTDPAGSFITGSYPRLTKYVYSPDLRAIERARNPWPPGVSNPRLCGARSW